jgi:hypothetical protein
LRTTEGTKRSFLAEASKTSVNWDLDSTYAIAVNNRGEIVGGGLLKDRTEHNFVLIPVHGH